MRFGPGMNKAHTLEEVAPRFSVTRERMNPGRACGQCFGDPAQYRSAEPSPASRAACAFRWGFDWRRPRPHKCRVDAIIRGQSAHSPEELFPIAAPQYQIRNVVRDLGPICSIGELFLLRLGRPALDLIGSPPVRFPARLASAIGLSTAMGPVYGLTRRVRSKSMIRRATQLAHVCRASAAGRRGP